MESTTTPSSTESHDLKLFKGRKLCLAGSESSISKKNRRKEMPANRGFSTETEKDLISPISTDSELADGKLELHASGTATKIYRRRWGILILFALYSMSNAYQWIHLNIIADVLLVYYNQSLPELPENKSLAIDWLSMVYMLAYIPLIFPATWLLDRKGLRWIALLGTFLNCLGAWMKCVSIAPGRFWLLMTAQSVCAVAQIFILGMPARLAAVWFGPDQVSTATAIGVFGNQVGVALGFVIPPYVVQLHNFAQNNFFPSMPNTTTSTLLTYNPVDNMSSLITNTTSNSAVVYDLSETALSMKYLFYGGASYMTILFILVLFVFQKEPPHPPSMAQYKIVQDASEENYLASLLRLIKNGPFMLLVITYGFNVGLFYAIGTLLNPTIFGYFSKEEYPRINEEAGWIGLTIVIAGLFGSVIAGIWLDRTKTFKVTSVIIYFMSFVGMLTFTFTMYLYRVWVVFLTAGFLGLSMTGYLPVGFEFAAELTYPESEGTSSGLLNASAQTIGIILTLVMGWLGRLDGNSRQDNIRNANFTGCTILLLGALITICIKNNLKRQKAEQSYIDESSGENLSDEKSCGSGTKP